jgi:hypothetical protein
MNMQLEEVFLEEFGSILFVQEEPFMARKANSQRVDFLISCHRQRVN